MKQPDKDTALRRLDQYADFLADYPPIKAISSAAGQLEVEPALVGGVLRDAILDIKTADLDLCVEHDAKEFAQLVAEETGGTFVSLDDVHGSARVVFKNKESIDVADYRRPTLLEDCLARDLTCNALAAPLQDFLKRGSKAVLDPAGAMDDILRGIIRPYDEKSFQEDPLRILRAFRYGATLGFAIIPETLAMISRNSEHLKSIAPERILNEFRLIFRSNNARSILPAMLQTGTLYSLFGFFTKQETSGWVGRATFIEKALDRDPPLPGKNAAFVDPKGFRLVIMLAASLPGTHITDLIVALRLSRNITGRVMRVIMALVSVKRLIRDHPIKKDFLNITARVSLMLRDDRLAPWLILASQETEDEKHIFHILEKAEKLTVEKIFPLADAPPLVTGAQLVKEFDRAPGSWISEVLEKIFFERLEGTVTDEASAVECARQFLKETSGS